MNKFLRILSSLVLMVVGVVCFSNCTTDDNDAVGMDQSFKVSAQVLTFSQTGGTATFSVRAPGAVDVKSSGEWCALESLPSESKVTRKFQVTVAPNAVADAREAQIVVSSGSDQATIRVLQEALDYLLVKDHSELAFAPEGGTLSVTLAYSGDYQVDIADGASWITQVSSRAVSESTLHFSIAPNKGGARSGQITFTLGDAKQTLTVSQSAQEVTMTSDAKTIASKIYTGWNLGNTLEATGGETAWNPIKVTEALIKQVKAYGFNAVRIPCSWDQYIEDPATYKISESWMNRVGEVIDYCINNDVYAILNIHWDGGWLENHCTPEKQEANNQKQRAIWTQIAERYKDYGEYLLFAGCNEPNVENAQQMEVLLSYEQTFIDAVRATGGNNAQRCLIVQGPSTDIDKTESLMNTLPVDPAPNRLMVEVHYYSPWQFCGLEEDASWGKMQYFWGAANHVSGSDRNADSKFEEDYVKTQFAKMKKRFVDQGVPVILGEYGAMHRTLSENQDMHDKSRGYFSEVVTREAKNAGMVPFFWDGGGFAMINRQNCEIGDTYVYDGIMKGAKEGKYPY